MTSSTRDDETPDSDDAAQEAKGEEVAGTAVQQNAWRLALELFAAVAGSTGIFGAENLPKPVQVWMPYAGLALCIAAVVAFASRWQRRLKSDPQAR